MLVQAAFLDQRAGFDIGEGVVPYTPEATFLRAFAAGVANTLRVSFLGILLATPLGVLVGLGRLSRNVLVRALATVWVEVLRNVPLVIQLVAWYLVLTQLLPDAASPLTPNAVTSGRRRRSACRAARTTCGTRAA